MPYVNPVQKALVGKLISGYKLSNDKTSITFELLGGSITLDAVGDCCSYSWIESIDTPDNLQGTVLSVEDIDMPDLGDMPNCYCVTYYGLKIVTTQGTTVIDYRNDSNGYYGGSLELRG